VLLVTLIALLVMLIGAVALLRSANTASAIAGNMASKQAAMEAADTAIQAAAVQLTALTAPDTSVTGSYFATQQTPDDANGLPPFTWTGVTVQQVGNFQVQYLIDRLCDAPLPVLTTNKPIQCAVAPAIADVTSHKIGSPTANLLPIGAVYYRVTARVVGPKNSESYAQAILSK
jgi:type IV pilus assembly protein PilX